MLRFFLSYAYEGWWRFCLCSGHKSYAHATWRIWQEQEYRRGWLTDGVINEQTE
jgi:hypothetical protein